jgi:hypothetical protein
MADPSRHSDTGGIPRWVKVSGIIAVLVALLVVVVLLSGGGSGHGPQRHGGAGGDAPLSSLTESAGIGGHTPPAGVPTRDEHARRGTFRSDASIGGSQDGTGDSGQ